MVLMPHPYKEDRELEEELREADRGKILLKRLCSPDTLYGRFLREEKHHQFPNHITKEFLLEKMEMQEMQIKYLLDNVRFLQQSKEVQTEVVVVEEVSKEEGKRLVETYFKEHGSADMEELMLNLRISIQSLVEIIDDLRSEGKLIPHQDEKGL